MNKFRSNSSLLSITLISAAISTAFIFGASSAKAGQKLTPQPMTPEEKFGQEMELRDCDKENIGKVLSLKKKTKATKKAPAQYDFDVLLDNGRHATESQSGVGDQHAANIIGRRLCVGRSND